MPVYSRELTELGYGVLRLNVRKAAPAELERSNSFHFNHSCLQVHIHSLMKPTITTGLLKFGLVSRKSVSKQKHGQVVRGGGGGVPDLTF